MRMIDLSIPVSDGDGRLGLECDFQVPYTFENCGWRGTVLKMFAHYGSHIDAPIHSIPEGKTIDQVPLNRLVGPAAVVDLKDHGRQAAITGETLDQRGGHVERGDIAILKTTWTDQHWGTDMFWKDGPYLTADAADWLVERGVKAVVYDFSQEYVVHTPGFHGDDCVVHHKLLGNEIYNIEYVRNLDAIRDERVAIIALPLKLVDSDGSPARVVALEGIDMPREFEVEYG